MTPPQHKGGRTSTTPSSSPTELDAATGDPLADLVESERLTLAIRFGRIRMCAALTHGHSFESSIFKLPAPCICGSMVWGPFTRGCTCLTCNLTVHRACTGMENMPLCPTKTLFQSFCRAELHESGTPEEVPGTQQQHGVVNPSKPREKNRSGDLEEWAKVEGGAEESSRAGETSQSSSSSLVSPPAPPPASALQQVRDHGSSFSWSPFGLSDRKRLSPSGVDVHELPNAAAATGDEQRRGPYPAPSPIASAVEKPSSAMLAGKPVGGAPQDPANPPDSTTPPAATAATGTGGGSEISSFGKISVAGGVVGAVLAGPCGAVVGLKLGAVVAASRWSVRGVWKRIEKERKEAGADGIGVRDSALAAGSAGTTAEAAAGERSARDIWALIAERIEGEERPLEWELDREQKERLDQGECDAAEVSMFIVVKILEDETAMPSRLYHALLTEFRSRHRLCDCGRLTGPRLCCCDRRTGRRSRDTDIVSLFPRSGGSYRSTDPATNGSTGGGKDSRTDRSDSSDQQDESSFFARTPGLEKTFSFVEETEIVEGEGSDTFVGDDDDSSAGDDVKPGDAATCADRVIPRVTSDTPSDTIARFSSFKSDECSNSATARHAVGTASCKDVWKNTGSRMDSWVELEGMGCNSCGGRKPSGKSNGRFAGLLPEDIEEDEEGFGESWAEADAPSCWCTDEAGLSASPESLQSTTHGPRNDSTGCRPKVTQMPNSAEPTVRGDECPEQVNERPDGNNVAAGGSAVFDPELSAEARPDNGTGNVTAEGDREEEKRGRGAEDSCDPLRDVHGVLRELTRVVLEWCPLLTASDEAAIQAVNCIDQRVFTETYGPVYGRIATGQAHERDATLARRVRRDARARMDTGRPTLVAMCQPQALTALRAAGAARTGRDKLGCLVQAVEEISEALPAQATTDTLLWSLCRHMAAATISTADATEAVEMVEAESFDTTAPLPRPHAEVAFVEQFMRDESWLMGKQGYVLTTVGAALHVLLDPTMSDAVFLDPKSEHDGGISN